MWGWVRPVSWLRAGGSRVNCCLHAMIAVIIVSRSDLAMTRRLTVLITKLFVIRILMMVMMTLMAILMTMLMLMLMVVLVLVVAVTVAIQVFAKRSRRCRPTRQALTV